MVAAAGIAAQGSRDGVRPAARSPLRCRVPPLPTIRAVADPPRSTGAPALRRARWRRGTRGPGRFGRGRRPAGFAHPGAGLESPARGPVVPAGGRRVARPGPPARHQLGGPCPAVRTSIVAGCRLPRGGGRAPAAGRRADGRSLRARGTSADPRRRSRGSAGALTSGRPEGLLTHPVKPGPCTVPALLPAAAPARCWLSPLASRPPSGPRRRPNPRRPPATTSSACPNSASPPAATVGTRPPRR